MSTDRPPITNPKSLPDAVERVRETAMRHKDDPEYLVCVTAVKDLRTILSQLDKLETENERLTVERDEFRIQVRSLDASLQRVAAEAQDGFAALEEMDEAWAATGYAGNRDHLTLAEQISSLVREIDSAAQASNASLVGALRPFAAKWDALKDPLPQGPFMVTVDAMDCCRARQALSTLESGEAAADNNPETVFTPEHKQRAMALLDPCMELEDLDAARTAHRAAPTGPSVEAIAAVEARLKELLDSVNALVGALPDAVVEGSASEIERVIEALGACSIQELDALTLSFPPAADNNRKGAETAAPVLTGWPKTTKPKVDVRAFVAAVDSRSPVGGEGVEGGLLHTIEAVRHNLAKGLNYGFPRDTLPDLILWLECAAVGRTAPYPAPVQGDVAGLADVLVMTGCKDRQDLEDMANVGKSLIERIHLLTKDEGPFHNWTPADDPAEIVFDLVNHYEDALAAPPSPSKADVGALVEALTKSTNALRALKLLVKAVPALQGREHDHLGVQVNNALVDADAALASFTTSHAGGL